MAGNEPGERPSPGADQPARQASRQLERAPGERYARPADDSGPGEAVARQGRALFSAVVKAVVAAVVGALLLYALGALLSSSAGLVFVAGLTGAAVGLLLARAAAPGRDEAPALTRRTTTWLAVAIAILAVVVGAAGTWLHAVAEGGVLGPVDYLFETFGLTIPLELLIGAVAATWGAGAGPVET